MQAIPECPTFRVQGLSASGPCHEHAHVQMSCKRFVSTPPVDIAMSIFVAGHTKCIMSMAWEPAHVEMPCRRFVSASQDGTAKVWDTNTRRCVFTLSGHTRPVTCVKWGGDGFIHTSSRDGSIMVWDAKVCKDVVGAMFWFLGMFWHGCGCMVSVVFHLLQA